MEARNRESHATLLLSANCHVVIGSPSYANRDSLPLGFSLTHTHIQGRSRALCTRWGVLPLQARGVAHSK